MIDQIPDNDYMNSSSMHQIIKPVTEYCITQTAKRFSLPEALLRSVMDVENGKVGELRVNKNGTYDIGPMQINSKWLNKFSGYVSKEDLLYNGCKNIQVGAWILRYNIDKAGNIWQGIGNYHSKTKQKHIDYRSKVITAMQKYKTSIDSNNNTQLT